MVIVNEHSRSIIQDCRCNYGGRILNVEVSVEEEVLSCCLKDYIGTVLILFSSVISHFKNGKIVWSSFHT